MEEEIIWMEDPETERLMLGKSDEAAHKHKQILWLLEIMDLPLSNCNASQFQIENTECPNRVAAFNNEAKNIAWKGLTS